MKTELSTELMNTTEGKEAYSILRTCVHCGFCNATCPTYQLLGDEKDGPRGRIYLIKQLLEGKEATKTTQQHLDRCLTCRSCETTCPSGVKYSHLLEIGRKHIETKIPRSLKSRVVRKLLLNILPYEKRFTPLMRLGQTFKPLTPKILKKKIPIRTNKGILPKESHKRRMLILDGCVQPAMSPDINAATARVLNKLGITVVAPKKAGCCGAVSLHLSAEEAAHNFMRNNIDVWWPEIESGAEAIIMTASGCGSMVKEYGHQLKHDPA
jgi:glycolate oxidase iron-sulfur subunit